MHNNSYCWAYQEEQSASFEGVIMNIDQFRAQLIDLAGQIAGRDLDQNLQD